MIIAKEKIFYFHVPKTGGTTIEYFLGDLFNIHERNYTAFFNGFVAEVGPGGGTIFKCIVHLPYKKQLTMAANSDIEIDNTWNIFTIVRNPYYRAMSAIFFQGVFGCKYHMHTLPTIIEKRKLFTDAYTSFFTTDPLVNDWWQHRTPQYKLLESNPVDNLPPYKIYKYESGLENILRDALNLDKDFKFNLKTANSIDGTFRTPKTDYNTLLTSGFIETVNEYYKEDFEMFNYEMLNPLDFPED